MTSSWTTAIEPQLRAIDGLTIRYATSAESISRPRS
jgi:hypothetical protein